jgi:hypothetical protein
VQSRTVYLLSKKGQNMNQLEKSYSVATAGAFRTPDHLVGDVSRRDREWADWERDGIQSVVNQLNELLLKNYPGKGWMRIRLKGESYGSSHPAKVYEAFQSAFGDEFQGLRNAVADLFPSAQWRVIAKYESARVVFFFQPLSVPTTWYERWFKWVRAVAEIDDDLDCNKIAPPPASLRPNHRNQAGGSTEGVTVGSDRGGHGPAEVFAYENLC